VDWGRRVLQRFGLANPVTDPIWSLQGVGGRVSFLGFHRT
jgi:hypothetical protein